MVLSNMNYLNVVLCPICLNIAVYIVKLQILSGSPDQKFSKKSRKKGYYVLYLFPFKNNS